MLPTNYLDGNKTLTLQMVTWSVVFPSWHTLTLTSSVWGLTASPPLILHSNLTCVTLRIYIYRCIDTSMMGIVTIPSFLLSLSAVLLFRGLVLTRPVEEWVLPVALSHLIHVSFILECRINVKNPLIVDFFSDLVFYF